MQSFKYSVYDYIVMKRKDSSFQAVLPAVATPSNLDAPYFIIIREKRVFNPIAGFSSSRAIQNKPDMQGYLR